jgi:hypothetical protein
MCKNLNHIEVIDPIIVKPKTMSTLALRIFEDSILKMFPNSKPHVFTDDDGNVETAKVFVATEITSQECAELDIVSDNHNLDFAIKSTGAPHGLVIEFNK